MRPSELLVDADSRGGGGAASRETVGTFADGRARAGMDVAIFSYDGGSFHDA